MNVLTSMGGKRPEAPIVTARETFLMGFVVGTMAFGGVIALYGLL